MGFENRKSVRVKLESTLYFWPEGKQEQPGHWGRTSNVSATGLAFHCAEAGFKGDDLLLELTLPGQKSHLRLPAKVVHCERDLAGERHFQWRVNFAQLEDDARHQVRLFVLAVAEPDAGWGRAYFPGHQAVDMKYKEMPPADREQWLKERSYLSMKELVYLKNFQDLLEHATGSRIPESLKLSGSRILRDGADVWMELDLPMGHLHFLGKVLWCRQEAGEKPEAGLQLTAFHKDEAMKLEKEF
jgi:Tfp pilus assembly protein PilZ